MMRLATISDIHGDWDKVQYPPADVLIFAGDIFGDYANVAKRIPLITASMQLEELCRFNIFLGKLLETAFYKAIIVVAGNHDYVFEQIRDSYKLLTNAYYLENFSVILDGVKFYGSPFTPWFFDWAFNLPCREERYSGDPEHAYEVTKLCWDNIPDDVNVLITHGPPWGILDQTYSGTMAGCPILERRIEELPHLQVHIFGHIHYGYGRKTLNINGRPIQFINTAIYGEDEEGNNRPIHSLPVITI